jgi:hypothetical protein
MKTRNQTINQIFNNVKKFNIVKSIKLPNYNLPCC